MQGAGTSSREPSWPRSPRRSPPPVTTRRPGWSVSESARNRFVGLVTRVVRDTVMAQVEIQAGPHRVVSLMSREAADELAAGARRARHRGHQVHQRRRRATGAVMRTRHPLTALAVAGASAVALAACAPAPRRVRPRRRRPAASTAAITGTVNVFAAASLQESFTDARASSSRPTTPASRSPRTSAPSSALAEQIRQGAPADVFASASQTNMDTVVKAGDAERPRRTSRRTSWRSPSRRTTRPTSRSLERPGQAGRQGRGVPAAGAVRRGRRRRCSPTPRSP